MPGSSRTIRFGRFVIVGPLRTDSSLLARCIDDHPTAMWLCESEINRCSSKTIFWNFYSRECSRREATVFWRVVTSTPRAARFRRRSFGGSGRHAVERPSNWTTTSQNFRSRNASHREPGGNTTSNRPRRLKTKKVDLSRLHGLEYAVQCPRDLGIPANDVLHPGFGSAEQKTTLPPPFVYFVPFVVRNLPEVCAG